MRKTMNASKIVKPYFLNGKTAEETCQSTGLKIAYVKSLYTNFDYLFRNKIYAGFDCKIELAKKMEDKIIKVAQNKKVSNKRYLDLRNKFSSFLAI